MAATPGWQQHQGGSRATGTPSMGGGSAASPWAEVIAPRLPRVPPQLAAGIPPRGQRSLSLHTFHLPSRPLQARQHSHSRPVRLHTGPEPPKRVSTTASPKTGPAEATGSASSWFLMTRRMNPIVRFSHAWRHGSWSPGSHCQQFATSFQTLSFARPRM